MQEVPDRLELAGLRSGGIRGSS